MSFSSEIKENLSKITNYKIENLLLKMNLILNIFIKYCLI